MPNKECFFFLILWLFDLTFKRRNVRFNGGNSWLKDKLSFINPRNNLGKQYNLEMGDMWKKKNHQRTFKTG